MISSFPALGFQQPPTDPFVFVLLAGLIAGFLGWLIAAVFGILKSRGAGPAARWFTMAAICMCIFQLQFPVVLVVANSYASQHQNLTLAPIVRIGAGFYFFVPLAALFALIGFIKQKSVASLPAIALNADA